MTEQKHTVCIIDDDPEVCNAMRWLFESVKLNVQTYQDAQNFLINYDFNMKGVLLIDVRLPLMSGLDLLDKLNSMNNKMPIIIITGYGDIPMAIRAIKSGAVDFIVKPIHDQSILELVQKYLQIPVETDTSKNYNLEKIKTLTPREKEVLNLVVDGKLNKEIAHELNISISTVEAHRSRIMNKMQIKNLAQLIRVCLSFPQEYENVLST